MMWYNNPDAVAAMIAARQEQHRDQRRLLRLVPSGR